MPRLHFTDKEARALTAMAIHEGLISTEEPCCICGAEQQRSGSRVYVVRHHPDLTGRPLWTVPLCRPHHQAVHLGDIPDPATSTVQLRPWQRSPELFDVAIRHSAREGRRPKKMPVDVWQKAIAERGLEAQMHAARTANGRHIAAVRACTKADAAATGT